MLSKLLYATHHASAIHSTTVHAVPKLWADFLDILHVIAHAFPQPFDLAMVATMAVLLTLTSPRNIHLSDRSRANVSEALYQLTTSSLPTDARLTRLRSLMKQNEQFDKRYKRMSHAFLLLIICMVGFLVGAAYRIPSADTKITLKDQEYFYMEMSGGFVLLSLLAFGIVLCLLASEFGAGSRTLKWNSSDFAIARDCLKPDATLKAMKVIPLKRLISRVFKALQTGRKKFLNRPIQR